MYDDEASVLYGVAIVVGLVVAVEELMDVGRWGTVGAVEVEDETAAVGCVGAARVEDIGPARSQGFGGDGILELIELEATCSGFRAIVVVASVSS